MEFFQKDSELFPGTIDERADCPGRHTQYIGDFLVGIPFYASEHYRFAIFAREMGNRVLDTVFHIFLHEVLLWRIPVRDRLNNGGIGFIVDGYVSYVFLVFPKLVHRRIVSDSVYPT